MVFMSSIVSICDYPSRRLLKKTRASVRKPLNTKAREISFAPGSPSVIQAAETSESQDLPSFPRLRYRYFSSLLAEDSLDLRETTLNGIH